MKCTRRTGRPRRRTLTWWRTATFRLTDGIGGGWDICLTCRTAGADRAAENLSRRGDGCGRAASWRTSSRTISLRVLSGGSPGIAQTQIAYASTEGGNKEIWVMDYDGQNQHQLTHLKSISLTPRWSPNAERIAFTCYVPFRGITSPQICIYSSVSDRLISFPRYRGSNSSPAWSPDGLQLAFMSSQNGDPEIYLTDAEWRKPEAHHFCGGSEHFPGVESEDRQANCVCQRSRRRAGAVPGELGRHERAKVDMADMGLRRGSGMVTKWTIACI